MAGPQVSAISIFYNAEAYFSEAVDSVLGQSFGDLELILADDGSNDSSSEIARSYAERYPDRVRYVYHPGRVNKGMSATPNLGLRHARCQYVAFIDADDRWRSNKLGEQMKVAAAHPQLGMICGTVNYWRSWSGGEDCAVGTGHRQDAVIPPPEASLAVYPLGTAAAPCPSDMLLRRDAIAALGGFEEHFTGARMMYEDQGFLAKLYLAYPVWFDRRIWLDYRQHADSCVAEVQRAGGYDDVRQYFLQWLQAYAATHRADAGVRKAITRALLPYRHPTLELLRKMPAQTSLMLRNGAKRLVHKAVKR